MSAQQGIPGGRPKMAMSSQEIGGVFLDACGSEEGQRLVQDSRSPARSFQSKRQGCKQGVLVGSAVLLGSALALLVIAHRQRGVGTGLRSGHVVSLDETTESCHTAVAGEQCAIDVTWAKTNGIVNHPEWYADPCPDLTVQASFEEFQACVYKINMTTCPLPCAPEGQEEALKAAVDKTNKDHPSHRLAHRADPCHLARKGEQCFDFVVHAMLTGVIQEPEKFPGLTASSSFEEFQAFLHKDPGSTSCPRPCSCHTAKAGEECKGHVDWALTEGIINHPTWYHGLSMDSTFEEVQAYLHKDDKGACPLPCNPTDPEVLKKAVQSKAMAEGAVEDAVSCNEAAWPDKDHGLICGECKVLVDRFDTHYKTCEGFCTEIGRKCVGAWEDLDDTCEVKEPLTCDQAIASSDAICKCGEELPEVAMVAGEAEPKASDDTGGRSSSGSEPSLCHTAEKGQSCYDDVMFGMQHGIYEHPEWYPGLSEFSTFEEFQAVLHLNPKLDCPKPCPCHTAKIGEECYDNVKWVLREGIAQHPSWYPALTERSRWEEVQARLHEDENTTCHTPCTPRIWGTPSLFCVAVFRSTGYELGLVKSLVEKGVGIFKCDEFAVLSDKVLDVAKGIKTLIIPPCETVGISKDGTAANTLIFMQAWSVIYNDVRWKAHDWIIKADPDAVLLPDRLRKHLAPHTGKNVWMTNCMKYTGPGWPMMFGSLEAFSNEAMTTYYKGAMRCKHDLSWQAWGEDLFMGKCLEYLGAQSVFDGGLIGDNVCKGANCADGTTAAYHPFKSTEGWFQCYETAMR